MSIAIMYIFASLSLAAPGLQATAHRSLTSDMVAQAASDETQQDDQWVDGSAEEQSESSKKQKKTCGEPDFTTPFPQSCSDY
jgi:hypothetical protein